MTKTKIHKKISYIAIPLVLFGFNEASPRVEPSHHLFQENAAVQEQKRPTFTNYLPLLKTSAATSLPSIITLLKSSALKHAPGGVSKGVATLAAEAFKKWMKGEKGGGSLFIKPPTGFGTQQVGTVSSIGAKVGLYAGIHSMYKPKTPKEEIGLATAASAGLAPLGQSFSAVAGTQKANNIPALQALSKLYSLSPRTFVKGSGPAALSAAVSTASLSTMLQNKRFKNLGPFEQAAAAGFLLGPVPAALTYLPDAYSKAILDAAIKNNRSPTLKEFVTSLVSSPEARRNTRIDVKANILKSSTTLATLFLLKAAIEKGMQWNK